MSAHAYNVIEADWRVLVLAWYVDLRVNRLAGLHMQGLHRLVFSRVIRSLCVINWVETPGDKFTARPASCLWRLHQEDRHIWRSLCSGSSQSALWLPRVHWVYCIPTRWQSGIPVNFGRQGSYFSTSRSIDINLIINCRPYNQLMYNEDGLIKTFSSGGRAAWCWPGWGWIQLGQSMKIQSLQNWKRQTFLKQFFFLLSGAVALNISVRRTNWARQASKDNFKFCSSVSWCMISAVQLHYNRKKNIQNGK